MEKNSGESFPESWIWTQGAAAHPEKVHVGENYVTTRESSPQNPLTHLLLCLLCGAFELTNIPPPPLDIGQLTRTKLLLTLCF